MKSTLVLYLYLAGWRTYEDYAGAPVLCQRFVEKYLGVKTNLVKVTCSRRPFNGAKSFLVGPSGCRQKQWKLNGKKRWRGTIHLKAAWYLETFLGIPIRSNRTYKVYLKAEES